MNASSQSGDAEAALALWAGICAAPASPGMAWIEGRAVPTLVPFDTLAIISGVGAIAEHLAARQRSYGTAELVSSPLAWWEGEGGLIVVADAVLRHSPAAGPAEARSMILVIGAATEGVLRLRHVTEAVPAVLPLVIETYRSSRPGQVK